MGIALFCTLLFLASSRTSQEIQLPQPVLFTSNFHENPHQGQKQGETEEEKAAITTLIRAGEKAVKMESASSMGSCGDCFGFDRCATGYARVCCWVQQGQTVCQAYCCYWWENKIRCSDWLIRTGIPAEVLLISAQLAVADTETMRCPSLLHCLTCSQTTSCICSTRWVSVLPGSNSLWSYSTVTVSVSVSSHTKWFSLGFPLTRARVRCHGVLLIACLLSAAQWLICVYPHRFACSLFTSSQLYCLSRLFLYSLRAILLDW